MTSDVISLNFTPKFKHQLNVFPDVQFSREQARKDPDNFFNLRSEFYSNKSTAFLFFVRILVFPLPFH